MFSPVKGSVRPAPAAADGVPAAGVVAVLAAGDEVVEPVEPPDAGVALGAAVLVGGGAAWVVGEDPVVPVSGSTYC